MENRTALDLFTREVASILDSGEKVSLDEVNEQLEKNNLVHWFKQKFNENEGSVVLNSIEEENEKYINQKLKSEYDTHLGNESKNIGIRNNGLVLLMYYLCSTK